MKQAVPGQHPAKTAAKVKPAHVGDLPVLIRKAVAAKRDEGRGAIHACHRVPGGKQVGRDRASGAAPDIQQAGAGLCQIRETPDPGLLALRALVLAVFVPARRMALVKVEDVFRRRAHRPCSGQLGRRVVSSPQSMPIDRFIHSEKVAGFFRALASSEP